MHPHRPPEPAVHLPTAVHPAAELQPHAAGPVVWVPSATDPNVMVAVPKHYLQPAEHTPTRDLTPQPLIDPRAQLVVAGGIGAGAAGAGIGWGIGQAAAGIAAFSGSSAAIVALLLLLAARAGRGRAGSTTHIHTEVHNHNRGFGRSTTTTGGGQ